MFVNTNQIQIGLSDFIDREIGAKATENEKFVVYFLSPIVTKMAVKYINLLKDNEFATDFFNDNGDVDLDALYENSKQAIKKCGTFQWKKIIFNESDIDKLYSYIRNTQRG